MNISTTFLNALRHTSSDVEGQRSPEILLGQIYKVSLEDKRLFTASGRWGIPPVKSLSIMNGTPFLLICCSTP